MINRLRLIVVVAALVIAGLAAIRLVAFPDPFEPETPLVTFATPAPHAELTMLVVAQNWEKNRQVLVCHKHSCTAPPTPAGLPEEAVFDGDSWYYYREALSEKSRLQKRILQRVAAGDGQTEQIMEDTPLTSPQGLLISPNGQYVVFYLDNVDRPDEQLTELWYYDASKRGIRLLVEKLYRPDLLTRVRWNKASSAIWFLADSGEEADSEDKVELIVATINPPRVAATLPRTNWQALKDVVDHGVMDISSSGRAVAYAHRSFLRAPELVVARAGATPEHIGVRDEITYLQWLEDDSLVYAVQDGRGFSFWRLQGTVSRFLARRPSRLVTAVSDVRGEYVAFAAQNPEQTADLFSLHVPSGTVQAEGALPVAQTYHLAQVTADERTSTPVSDSEQNLDDAQIAAFIDQHYADILGSPTFRPRRLVVTDAPNTVFIDYPKTQNTEERVLLTITDTMHADWSIKARYVARQAEWHKVQGGGLPDPKSVRLYEWEDSVKQWILKTSF